MADGWTFDLVDDALEIPGWLLVPAQLDADQQEDWVRSVAGEVVDLGTWDGHPLPEEEARELLRAALDLRAASDSMAILQVWPTMANHTAFCHVDVVPSGLLPVWGDGDDVVHRIDEPHLGPGLQIVTSRTVSVEGVEMDVASVTFAFDDGNATLVIGVTETFTPLMALTMPGLLSLMRSARLTRVSDGAVFASIEPAGARASEDWDREVLA